MGSVEMGPVAVAVAAPAPASATALLRGRGQVATGITVVTVRDGDGAHGMTVNAFTVVSFDPPIVSLSIARRSRTHQLLAQQVRCAVSVLATAHREWSDRFAGRHGDTQGRFDDVPHRLTADGLPIIDSALASFVCRLVAVHPAGDHSLFIGQVEQIKCNRGAEPLLYFGGEYRALA